MVGGEVRLIILHGSAGQGCNESSVKLREGGGGGPLAGDWLEKRSGFDSCCRLQLERGRNDELVKGATNVPLI